ncbi:MAG: MTH1187 family thiamine-binding protein [Candidatus Hodarchaeales archaeon]
MKSKIIAEIVTYPIGVGTSLSNYVKEAVKEIDSHPDIRVVHHPMGTVIEADQLETIFNVAKKAHLAIVNTGASRISTLIRIDDRRDKARRMEDKVKAVLEE